MNSSNSYTIWLEAAYCFFAEEGPENLSIKALAEVCGLPRTNFYYYFADKEELIDKIIELHFTSTTEIFNVELNKRFRLFIPDLYLVLYDFKLGLQFAKQLFKNREHSKFNEAHKKGVALSADFIVPKFKAFFKIDLPDEAVKSLYYTLTDAWYSRLNFEDFSVDSLCASCHEVMDSILPLIEKSIDLENKPMRTLDTPV